MQQEIARMESGRRVVRLDTAVKLANAGDVSLDWLTGRSNSGRPGNRR